MKKLLSFFILLMTCTQLFAVPIQKIIFFGDSLSDNGNLYAYSEQILPKSPPYFEGRFSNGLLWSDRLATYLKNRFNVTSENNALGGATVVVPSMWDDSVPATLKAEVKEYLSKSLAQKNKRPAMLFAIWIGANDYLTDIEQDPETLSSNVVDEIMITVRSLINEGGEHFLIMDLPDLSKSVRGRSSPDMAPRLALLSQLHHQKLSTAVNALKMQYPTLDFYYLDTYDLFNDLLAHPNKYNKKYHTHITNTTESCWLGGYLSPKNKMFQNTSITGLKRPLAKSPALAEANRISQLKALGEEACANPDEYVFWDEIHPTRVVHQIFAAIVEEKLKANPAAFEGNE